MPELPEVETTVRQLQKTIRGRNFVDVWTDFKKMFKRPKEFEEFKKELKGRKIEKVRRRGKNILFDCSGEKTILIHQKLTGHLLLGKWKKKGNDWQPPPGPLSERVNKYIHLLFTLNNGQMLALSDLRKFAKVELWNTEELERSEKMKSLGPDPLDKSFTYLKFKKTLDGQKRKIKQVLMDQEVIAGIGNIYSDEILFEAKIHPLLPANKLSERELKSIYKAIKKILPLAVKLNGESFSDYRRPSGEAGFFDKARKVYRREGEKCLRCGTKIKRVKVGGRSAYFCPNCQPIR